jgi:hypothetical protein
MPKKWRGKKRKKETITNEIIYLYAIQLQYAPKKNKKRIAI